MRSLIAIAGLFMALLMQALPASAHGDGDVGHDAQLVTRPAAAPAETTLAFGPCAFAGRQPVVVETINDGDHLAHNHDHSDHDPADHTHPFGEDPFHQMTAHFGLDFAAHVEPEMSRVPTETGLLSPPVDDHSSGITVPPPVPPPLG